jgi:hypothetical protein
VKQNKLRQFRQSLWKVCFNIPKCGGNTWLLWQPKYFWQVTIATIQTFHDRRPISTKLNLVASNSCNRKGCGNRLLQPKKIQAFNYIIQTMVIWCKFIKYHSSHRKYP